MRPRSGFTLLETLIVAAILISLAAVLYPVLADAGDATHVVAAASTARTVREQIELHQAIRDGRTSPEGYPESIEPRWFKGRRLPSDPWTLAPITVQVVSGPSTATAPNEVTFQIGPDDRPLGPTAWYNASNGSFCMKVPDYGTEAEIREKVALINEWDGVSTNKGRGGKAKGKGKDKDKDKGKGKGKDKDKGNGSRGRGNGHGRGR